MKKLILWMIKTFNVDIPTEKIITNVVEKKVYLPQNGVIEGDVTIKGNVLVTGRLFSTGTITAFGYNELKREV